MKKVTYASRRKKKNVHIKYFSSKKLLSLALGICLAVLASAYIANARYSADSSVNLPAGSCIKRNDKSISPSYTIKVLDANQQGVADKKIIVRAPLFTYNADKKSWNDPVSAKDYVASVGTVFTDENGNASIKVPYCTIGNKYFLGENNKIFRSINFYLENDSLPAQNISNFFNGNGYSLSKFKSDVVLGTGEEQIIFSILK